MFKHKTLEQTNNQVFMYVKKLCYVIYNDIYLL